MMQKTSILGFAKVLVESIIDEFKPNQAMDP